MEEKYGLIKGIECKLVKSNPELIEAMSKRTGIDEERMRAMLRYNVFTVSQFAQLTQLAVSSITNKTRPLMIDGKYDTELNYCYLFQDRSSDGPKFIIRDEKSEKYLKV
jgi:hypothetical protein